MDFQIIKSSVSQANSVVTDSMSEILHTVTVEMQVMASDPLAAADRVQNLLLVAAELSTQP